MSVVPADTFDSTDSMNDAQVFPGRIGRKIGILLAAGTFLILLFGTIPLWLSYRILINSELIEGLNNDIREINVIQARMLELEEAIEGKTAQRGTTSADIFAVAQKFRRELQSYATFHRLYNNKWIEKGEERALYENIRDQLVKITQFASTSAEHAGEMASMARAMTPELRALLTLHQRAVARTIAMNRVEMKWIFYLYYALIFVSVFSISGGMFWASRFIVRPLKHLASASREIASGNFSNRVKIRSTDEFGQLSHAFNLMAARLEKHKQLTRKMAILEERERLAREMHDGLAQNIGFLNLKIAQLERISPDANGDQVQQEIQSIKKIMNILYRDVRQAIFDLRIMVSHHLGFLPMLTEYLHDFSDQTGIHVDLLNEGEWFNELPPEVEVQLIRIIQEALTNIRKHARASRVTVSSQAIEGNWEIVIEDNGCGISHSQAPASEKKQLGLQTMDERARSVGGSMDVRDAFPLGTRVTILLPLSSASMEARM